MFKRCIMRRQSRYSGGARPPRNVGLLTYTDAPTRWRIGEDGVDSDGARDGRRQVGALSQKRLVKHAINNETFCPSACWPLSPRSNHFPFGACSRSPESSLGVRASLPHSFLSSKTTKLEPDLMTHFSRRSPSVLRSPSPDDQTDGGGGSS